MKTRFRIACLTALLSVLPLAHAAEDADAAALGQRLVAIDADPAANTLASLERLQARQAVQALETARSRARPAALEVAQWRVETAELAVRTELARREIERLDRDRADLLL